MMPKHITADRCIPHSMQCSGGRGLKCQMRTIYVSTHFCWSAKHGRAGQGTRWSSVVPKRMKIVKIQKIKLDFQKNRRKLCSSFVPRDRARVVRVRVPRAVPVQESRAKFIPFGPRCSVVLWRERHLTPATLHSAANCIWV